METPFTAIPNRSNKAKAFALIALAVVGAVAAFYVVVDGAAAEKDLINPNALKDLYTQWKLAYNVTYGGAEDAQRFKIFGQNYRHILRTNAAKKSYTLGLNKFASISREEFASIYLGYKGQKKAYVPIRQAALKKKVNLKAIPAAIDWTTKGAVTPVKDQGQCGSCWSFSTTGALEGLNFVKNNNLQSFSEQDLVDCSTSFGNEGCNGGLMDDAFQYVEAKGIALEAAYKYTGADGRCKNVARAFKIKAFTDVTPNDPNALKAAVAQQPVAVAIEADQDVFQFYTGGVITGDDCGTQLDHGVLAVGYGTQGGKDFFKVKNSWGATWGLNGYVLIGVGAGAGVCGIQSSASYPTL